MSLNGIFDEFDEEKKEEKPAPLEVPEPSKKPESESVPIPEEGDKADEKIEVKAPVPSEDEGALDLFEPAEEESARDKPVEDQPVDEEVAGETPAEETPEKEAPAVVVDDWFEPDKEEQAPTEIISKGSDGMGPLIGIEASPIVVPAVTAEVMREQMKRFQSLKASLLDKNKDIATIQNKPYVKRSGWRKLALAFNISDEIIREQKEEKGDDFEWRIWVKVWAPNGRSVVGIGACSTKERDFSHLEHDVYATAHTRAKNRALSDLIGSGEVSWEELRGFG